LGSVWALLFTYRTGTPLPPALPETKQQSLAFQHFLSDYLTCLPARWLASQQQFSKQGTVGYRQKLLRKLWTGNTRLTPIPEDLAQLCNHTHSKEAITKLDLMLPKEKSHLP
jgi:hypothetical protein